MKLQLFKVCGRVNRGLDVQLQPLYSNIWQSSRQIDDKSPLTIIMESTAQQLAQDAIQLFEQYACSCLLPFVTPTVELEGSLLQLVW
jgi:hypothetical protein